ncbi:hypothetical protein BDP27DRAFT_1347086 [Rhodocollybia butyracea]|uniref:Uncharacterized protein n=1 Tax=Rhodocollybia butyracea TaxID=206335 RepID=A0A9P5TXJ3_9AGAR|nr:hypothetical protein BDP27DRAFT_1347086 [Rhodocollybia butyracea]
MYKIFLLILASKTMLIGGPPIADGSDASVLATRKAVCGGVASSTTCTWCVSGNMMYSGTCEDGCCQNDYQTCAFLE